MDSQSERAQGAAPRLEAYVPRIESLLRAVIQHGGFDLAFAIRKQESQGRAEPEEPELIIDLSGRDSDLLLERGAALLNALEYLVLKGARLEEELFGKITFDCRDWRRLRAQELQLMAQIAAEQVIATGNHFTLNPMSPRDRRIIHLALKGQPQVRTVSEGQGSERKVVILPASPSFRA
jgi:spoIIIJ-associated protein